MKCPNCHHVLEAREFRGIELDLCRHCRGIWFDRDEVEQFRKSVEIAGPLQARFHDRFRRSRLRRRQMCPRCGRKDLQPGRLDKVRVARCGECFGVFATANALTQDLGRVETGGDVEGLEKVLDGVGVAGKEAGKGVLELFLELIF